MLRILLTTLLLVLSPVAMAFDSGPSTSGGSSAETQNLTAARKAIEAGDFRAALESLYKAAEARPKDADINNLLGYSHRKLGAKDRAFAYYQTALSIEPNHKGANAYLGQLFLELGDLPKAEERLAVLDRVCTFGCAEYTELKDAIAAFKARGGASSGY